MTGPTDTRSRIEALSPERRAVLEERLRGLGGSDGATVDRIEPRDRSRPAPLGIAQQREWTISRLRGANNVPGAFQVDGAIDFGRLSTVLTQLLERHEVLRTTIEIGPSGAPEQRVGPVTAVPTPVVDLSELSGPRQHERIREVCRTELGTPFAPDAVRRLRITLIRLAVDVHLCLLLTDHASSDAWSLAIMMREIATLYGEPFAGSALPPPRLQFADFAAWQRARVGPEQTAVAVAHWTRVLGGIEGVHGLPADRSLPSRPTYAGDTYAVPVPAPVVAGLKTLGERDHTSLFSALLAATSILLSRHLDRADVVVGSLVSGRTRVETEELVGCFANPLPLPMEVSGEQTLQQVVRQAGQTLADALEHQDLPFDRLVEELGLDRTSAQTSLSRMWINVITVPLADLEVPGLRFASAAVDLGLASVDLTLSAVPEETGVRLEWQYMTELFDRTTIELLANQFLRVLQQIVEDPELSVDQVKLGAVRVDDDPDPVVRSDDLVARIRQRCELAPYATAVAAGDAALGYADLTENGGRLAAGLRAAVPAGLAPLGLLLDGPSLGLGIFAALDGARTSPWVLLDPVAPPTDLTDRLATVGAGALLVADSGGRAGTGIQLIGLDGPSPTPASPGQVLPGHPAPDLASARGVVDVLGLGAGDRVWYAGRPGPDFPVTAVVATWLAGGTVILPPRVPTEITALLGLAARERVTVLACSVTAWRRLLADEGVVALPASVRLVVVDGATATELATGRHQRRVPVVLAPWWAGTAV